jgi:hypothetical protein
MRSPAESPRGALEIAARVVALALVAVMIWRLARPVEGDAPRVLRGTATLRDDALFGARARPLHLVIDAPLDPRDRARLAALAHSGHAVSWSAATQSPLALSASASREPSGAVRVRAMGSGAVVLRDAAGVLDTIPQSARGGEVITGAPSGAVTADDGLWRAQVAAPAPPTLHPVLVVGRAGWDAKFAIAALEEEGWKVETRLSVAPTASVTQGATAAADTSRYAAVLLLDSTATVAGLERFVASGGGLLLFGDAAAGGARSLAPAALGARRGGLTLSFDQARPLESLPLLPLVALKDDALVLATRGDATTIAARRIGAGRAVQLGYVDTWRWRMQGAEGAPAAHRAWLSGLVGGVAYARVRALDATDDGAPLAQLVAAVGPAGPRPAASAPDDILPRWLLPLLLAILLAEWISRRLRGAR